MKLEQPSVNRKIIVQWYDSEIACLLAIIFLFPILILGLVGINVASDTEQYQAFVWVPLLLTILSAGVIFSIAVRLIKRLFF